MDRTQACCASPRGGDRILARACAAICAALAAVCLTTAVPARAAAGDTSGASLRLLAGSTFFVEPGANAIVRFAVKGLGETAGWEVRVDTFGALHDRSHFEETLGGNTGGTVLSSQTVALSQLPTVGGGYQLTLSVSGGGVSSSGGQASVDLACATGSGSSGPAACGGVYPMRLTLVSPKAVSGSPPSLLSYLVYIDPAAVSDPLRFSWVLPWSLPHAVADSHGVVKAPTPKAVAALDAQAQTLSAGPHASVHLTVAPEAWTLERLMDGTRPGEQAAVASLASALAASGRETLDESFVPVDASSLVAAGLDGELTRQQERARSVLQASPVRPSHLAGDIWVTSGGADAATVGQLGDRARFAVVPPSAVADTSCQQTTCTQPFTLEASPGGTPEAMFSDPALAAEATSADPATDVLAAHQLIADLSLVYYEAPNASAHGVPAPRGLILVTPPSWTPDPAFVSAVLDGLAANPIVSAVTLSEFFAQVPAGVLGQPSTRRANGPTGTGDLPTRALHAERARIDEFAAAVAGGAGTKVAQGLGDLLLAAESAGLARGQGKAAVAGTDAALRTQLRKLTLPANTPIRLTSASARVPVTVTSTAPYPVNGTLTLSSDKILFGASPNCTPASPTSGGFTQVVCHMQLDRTSNTVYVQMRSRVSGDFHVSVSLTSHRLTLVDGNLTVRSMSTSVVSIVLSTGAAAVLLTWWARTSWRGRKRRRGAHLRTARRTTR